MEVGTTVSSIYPIVGILAILAALIIWWLRNRGKNQHTGNLTPNNLIPLPTGAVKQEAKRTVAKAIDDSGLDLEFWNTDKVAIYSPSPESKDILYYATPTIANCDKFLPGATPGIFYDAKGSFFEKKPDMMAKISAAGKTDLVYVIRIPDLSGKIEFINEANGIIIERTVAEFTTQSGPVKSSIRFARGSCILYFSIGDYEGYLLCWGE